MFNIFQTASWYVAFGAVFVLIIIAHVVTRVWERRRFSSDGHRAIERLRKLEHKEPRGGTEPRLTLQHAIEVQKVDFSLTAEPAPTAPPPPGSNRGSHGSKSRITAKPAIDDEPAFAFAGWNQGPGGPQIRINQERSARDNHRQGRRSLSFVVTINIRVHIR